ncbi:MAG TPA: hypothetical protein VFJ74_06155, partial [Gemmatimonadaceae bacterium]|nr:hypothetical protein [Gemmatimonadaceae bacterium]
RWPNVRLFPLTYAQLELLDENDDPVAGDDEGGAGDGSGDDDRPSGGASRDRSLLGRTRAAQLWIGLARAALANQTVDAAAAAAATTRAPNADRAAPAPTIAPPAAGAPAAAVAADDAATSTDPVVVARAIDAHARDVAYDQVVVGYLLQIAEELKTKRGREAGVLQRRISRLVGSLQPETLRRLLDMGGDLPQRRRFVLDASQGLAVDAVVELVRAAADTSKQTISHSMVRMLSKFARHTERGAPARREDADVAFREQVERLMSGWQLEDPNPDAYRRALEGLSRAAPVIETPEHALPAEPERVVQMGLELGAAGEAIFRAADALVARGRLAALLDWLEAAPATAARDALWSHVATPEHLTSALAASSRDRVLLARLTRRLGYAACAPLLDAIEGAADDTRRVQELADVLATAGPDAAAAAAARIADARWIVQRAFLLALGRLGALPAGFSAAEYARHPVAEVRREALQLMFASPNEQERDVAVCAALVDTDPRVVRVGLRAALARCPATALALLQARADDAELPPELRALAVRVAAGSAEPGVVRWLAERASTERHRLLGGLRLAPKSPETVSAIAALAERWSGHPVAEPVLALARASDDAELRRAAAAPRRGARPTHEMTAVLAAADDETATTTRGGGR